MNLRESAAIGLGVAAASTILGLICVGKRKGDKVVFETEDLCAVLVASAAAGARASMFMAGDTVTRELEKKK